MEVLQRMGVTSDNVLWLIIRHRILICSCSWIKWHQLNQKTQTHSWLQESRSAKPLPQTTSKQRNKTCKCSKHLSISIQVSNILLPLKLINNLNNQLIKFNHSGHRICLWQIFRIQEIMVNRWTQTHKLTSTICRDHQMVIINSNSLCSSRRTNRCHQWTLINSRSNSITINNNRMCMVQWEDQYKVFRHKTNNSKIQETNHIRTKLVEIKVSNQESKVIIKTLNPAIHCQKQDKTIFNRRASIKGWPTQDKTLKVLET